MAALKIYCFRALEITLDDEPVAFRSNKGRALLLYLAVEQGRAHSRTRLAGLLWPDMSEQRARQNLSQTLLEVRKALGDPTAVPPFFEIAAQSIAFQATSNQWLDTAHFEDALSRHDYVAATKLYRGDFLADFSVPDSDLWEEWLGQKREFYRKQALDAFFNVGLAQERAEQHHDALATFQRLLTLMPWHEEAHRAIMRLLAQTGQRSAALAQYDTLTSLLMDEFGVGPTAETDALYDQILAGTVTVAESQPGSISQSLPRHAPFQAPLVPIHFVGRSHEIASIHQTITTSSQQIYAIVGMGGVGKTTLATQLAHAMRGEYRDGVLWANPLMSNPLDIVASWANAYGHDFSQLGDLGSRSAAMRSLLAERRALIVIDNVERLSEIEPLLPGGTDCTVFVTTRDVEVATALNAQMVQLSEFSEGEALALLRQIVGAERIDAELSAAVELCTLCGDLPLAVEIAAQRLKSRRRMKIAQMVHRLGDQTERLALGISDRAVRASFEVSWEILNEEQKQIFPLLSLFEGRTFSLATVAYVAERTVIEAEEVLYTLESLSLVRTVEDDGLERYAQHPLLADFAKEKLPDSTIAPARFSDWYYEFVQSYINTSDHFGSEWENLLVAIARAYEQERWSLVVAFVEVLQPAWFQRARYSDARHGLQWAYQAAMAIEDWQAAARIMVARGEAALEQSDYSKAQELLADARQRSRDQGNQSAVANAQDLLARIAIEQNRYEDARTLLEDNLPLRLATGDLIGQAAISFQQARIAYANAEWAEADKLAQEALGLQQREQDTLGTIRTARLLAQIALQLKEQNRAIDYCHLAQSLCERTQNDNELAITLYTLTGIERYQQRYEAAKATGERSRALLRRMGDLRTEGLLLYQLSDIECRLGAITTAVDSAMRALEIFRQLNDKVVLVYTLLQMGDLHNLQNAGEQSVPYWKEAAMIAEQLQLAHLQQACAKRLTKELETGNGD